MKEVHKQGTPPRIEKGNIVAITKEEGGNVRYAIKHELHYELILLDAIGIAHPTGKKIPIFGTDQTHRVFKTALWVHKKESWWGDGNVFQESRIMGVDHITFPHPTGWKIGEEKIKLDDLGVRALTRIQAARKFKPPVSEKAWNERLPVEIKWSSTWRIKTTFATPRDCQTWLKLMHRNLFVANRDPSADPSCLTGCGGIESMLHLADCPLIRRFFWNDVLKLLTDLGMDPPEDILSFLLVGRMTRTKAIPKYHSDIMFIAWRCLYAALVKKRLDGGRLHLQGAFKRTVILVRSRAVAYGESWQRWCRKNRNTYQKHIIPEKHRKKILLQQKADGSYTINPVIENTLNRLQVTR